MKERGMIFNAEMVRAVLDGSKTQVRVPMIAQPSAVVRLSPFSSSGLEDGHGRPLICKYGQPGDRLWVNEEPDLTLEITDIRAERLQAITHDDAEAEGIHVEVWDQTVVARNYSEPDAFFQFWSRSMSHYVEMGELYRSSFFSLWESVYGKESLSANPWVWVIEFKRVEGE